MSSSSLVNVDWLRLVQPDEMMEDLSASSASSPSSSSASSMAPCSDAS